MKHSVFGKKLSRTKNERRILFRNLIRELIDHGSIVTTYTKAKAIQPLIEKLITKAKKKNEQNRRNIFSILTDRSYVKKLMDDAVTRFATRNSGYTRIIKTGPRRGDGTISVILSFVDEKPVESSIKLEKTKEIKPTKANPKQKRNKNKNDVKKK